MTAAGSAIAGAAAAAARRIAEAEAALAAGREVDLAPLEDEVRRLGDAARAAPAAEAAAVKDTLTGIIAALDRLESTLTERHRARLQGAPGKGG